MSGPAPFGMRWRDGKLAADPSEAGVLQELVETFVALRRVKAVASALNAKGRRTRQGAWSDTAVARVLRNPRLSNLITAELWQRCEQLLRDRAGHHDRLSRRSAHPLGGVVRCQCGAKMYLRDGGTSSKFVCRSCRSKIPLDTAEVLFCKGLSSVEIDADEIQASIQGHPGADGIGQALDGRPVRVSEIWPSLDNAERCQLVDLLVAQVVVGADGISVVLADSAGHESEKPRNSHNLLPTSHGSEHEAEQATRQGNTLRREDLGDLLTIEEVATLLRTTPKAIYSMIDRAQLPGVSRIGRRLRIRRDDLVAWLDESRASSRKERRP